MKKSKLNRFVIVSIAFHVVLISAVLLYFLKYPLSDGESAKVMVGVIGTQDSASGASEKGNTDVNNSESQKEISKPKSAINKNPQKESIKRQQTSRKAESHIETPETAKNEIKKISDSKQDRSDSATKKSTETTGTETASLGQTGVKSDSSTGTVGSNNTLAYPDYNHNPKPKYPKVARKRGYEGEVKLNVFVLPDGKVGKIEVLRPSGYKILDDEAIEAVKNWIFIPGKQDGKEISSWVTVPISFQLKSG